MRAHHPCGAFHHFAPGNRQTPRFWLSLSHLIGYYTLATWPSQSLQKSLKISAGLEDLPYAETGKA